MLLNLHIKNLALIEELEVDFAEGLNIMTGETGAGKSIIIGSIELALGTALCTTLYGILADELGWNAMILVWLGIGLFGVFFCMIFAAFWGKKRVALDEGRI